MQGIHDKHIPFTNIMKCFSPHAIKYPLFYLKKKKCYFGIFLIIANFCMQAVVRHLYHLYRRNTHTHMINTHFEIPNALEVSVK